MGRSPNIRLEPRPRHPLSRQLAFHFEPLEGDARHSILLRKGVYIRFLAAIHAGSEQTHGIGLDGFHSG